MRSVTRCVGVAAAAALLLGAPLSSLAANAAPGSAGKARRAGKVKRATAKNRANSIAVLGTLTSLSGNAATITTGSGVATPITLTTTTRFATPNEEAAMTGLRTGDQAVAIGKMVNGAFRAAVLEYSNTVFGLRSVVTGTVAGSTPQALVLNEPNGQTVTLAVNAQTRYFQRGKRLAVASALTVGQHVIVAIERLTNGQIQVNQVRATGARAAAAGKASLSLINGSISSASSTQLVVSTPTGSVTVLLRRATRFMVDGMRAASMPAFTTGQQVSIRAAKTAQGAYVARVVFSLAS